MKKTILSLIFLSLILLSCTAMDNKSVSGELKDGLRIINLKGLNKLDLTVYRGDYIIFNTNSKKNELLTISDLKISKDILPDPLDNDYIKMKSSGVYKLSIGQLNGTIKVIDLTAPNYKEVTAKEALNIIENINPLILDVRTTGEYKSGHINNSELIPVQILKENLDKLSKYKNEPIFVYCQSGNRSTVASKILIDNGFTNIYNLRYGIGDWISKGLPVTDK